MDCSFSTGEWRFNFRVGAVIVHDGRLLGVHDHGGDSRFNYLPGGRVHMGETMEEALVRELREELGVSARVIRPLWVRESLDGGDSPPYHGLEVYFLTELDWGAVPSLTGPFECTDTDGEEHFFRWLEPGDYIHPEFVSWPRLPESMTLITESSGPEARGDICFQTPDGLFNFRTAGLIIRDGLLLAMKEQGIGHYYLPGGRVRMGETMEEALYRELREELGVSARVLRPLWLCESFFPLGGRPVHEIAMYYLTEPDWEGLPALEGQFTLSDSDGAEHIYSWLTPEEVRSVRIYPVPMQECWPQLPEGFTLYTDTRDRKIL